MGDDPSAKSQNIMSPTVGIVTVLYNSEDVIEDFFASLACQSDVKFKLYVIDNSPSPVALDRCRELAEKLAIDAECVFNDANLGVAKGNNQGIELALRDKCEYVLLANNDTEFSAGTISTLVKTLRDGETVATPKILYYGPQRLIWYAGGQVGTWTMRTRHFGDKTIDHGQFDTPCYTKYAPTCFLLLCANVFAKVGYMDERYFVYYDDTDFMWRLAQAKILVRYVPSAVVKHKVSTSTGGEHSPFSVYYNNRNRIFFIRKNLRGMHKTIALCFVLTTRVWRALYMPTLLKDRLWAGVRDGFNL